MPYDMITPYGPSAIGVVSDDERMARQAAQARALAFQAQAAQESQDRDKRIAGAAAGAGTLDGDPFFAKQGPSQETLDMRARNSAVDARHKAESTAESTAGGGYGTDDYFNRRQLQRDAVQQSENKTLEETQQSLFRREAARRAAQSIGIGDVMPQRGSGFIEDVPYKDETPPPNINPNFEQGSGINLDGMGGGQKSAPRRTTVMNDQIGGRSSDASPGSSGLSEAEQLSVFGAIASGNPIPDLAANRDRSARSALELSALKAAAARAEEDTVRQRAAEEATRRNADDPMAQRRALKAAGQPVAASRQPDEALQANPLTQKFARDLALKMRKAMGTLTPAASAAALQPDINVLVQRLVDDGADPKKAREFVLSSLGDLDFSRSLAGLITGERADAPDLARGALGIPSTGR